MWKSSYLGEPSFGGGRLVGDRLMRVAYLDEAGVSDRKQEPYLVVAGVILDADLTWNFLEAHLREMVSKHFNRDAIPTLGRHFHFHAKDIWHGSGLFPREQWSLSQRMDLLHELCDVIVEFKLPVVYGFSNRKKLENDPLIQRQKTKKEKGSWLHVLAFIDAARRVDQWMERHAPEEVAILFAEDVDRDKKILINMIHALYVDRSTDDVPGAFQSKRIIEQVTFTQKHRCAIIQLADVCAFILKRKLQRCPKVEPLFKKLQGNIAHRSASDSGLFTMVKLSDLKPEARAKIEEQYGLNDSK